MNNILLTETILLVLVGAISLLNGVYCAVKSLKGRNKSFLLLIAACCVSLTLWRWLRVVGGLTGQMNVSVAAEICYHVPLIVFVLVVWRRSLLLRQHVPCLTWLAPLTAVMGTILAVADCALQVLHHLNKEMVPRRVSALSILFHLLVLGAGVRVLEFLIVLGLTRRAIAKDKHNVPFKAAKNQLLRLLTGSSIVSIMGLGIHGIVETSADISPWSRMLLSVLSKLVLALHYVSETMFQVFVAGLFDLMMCDKLKVNLGNKATLTFNMAVTRVYQRCRRIPPSNDTEHCRRGVWCVVCGV
jgi:hypothetical protein